MEDIVAIIALITFMIGLAIGSFIGSVVTEEGIQEEAVKAGYAEHNAISGDWQWKEGE